MNALFSFYQSSIGKKWVVALTGIVLVGYIFGHLAGNLQMYMPPERINAYGAFLHSVPALLWCARIVLLASFILHIVTTIKLVMENRAARPERYGIKASVQARVAARTMAVSGLVVLAFVVFHILHFTTRSIDARFHALPGGEFDIYTMLVWAFQSPFICAIYVVGLFLLCLHLSHGLASLLQTIGLNSKGLATRIGIGGRVVAWIIFIGYVSIPIAVLVGFLKS